MDALKWDGTVESLTLRFNKLLHLLAPKERDHPLITEKFCKAMPTKIYEKLVESGCTKFEDLADIASETEVTLTKVWGTEGEWTRAFGHRSDQGEPKRRSDQQPARDQRSQYDHRVYAM